MTVRQWIVASAVGMTAVISLGLGTAAGQRYLSRDRKGTAKPIFTRSALYLLMAPVSVSSEGVTETDWTVDGKHLVMVRRMGVHAATTLDEALESLDYSPDDIFVGAKIESFDVSTGNTRVLWQAEGVECQSITSYGKHDIVAIVSRPLQDLRTNPRPEIASTAIVINVQTGASKLLPKYQDIVGNLNVMPSPSAPLFLISSEALPNFSGGLAPAAPVAAGGGQDSIENEPSRAVQQQDQASAFKPLISLVDSTGRTLKEWPTDIGFNPIWTADGSNFFWKQVNRKKKTTTYYTLGDDGKPVKLDEPPAAYTEKAVAQNLQLFEVSFAPSEVAKFGHVSGLFLHVDGQKRPKDVLIAAGAKNFELSPTQDTITYELDHELKISRILKPGPEMFAALKKALKKKALSEAKQAGLAMLMYSNDFDDMFPGGSMGKEVVDPYLKSSAILDDFNYTPPSNLNSTQISNPATTILGTVDGLGGYAVVYVDGHAAWIDDGSGDDL